MGSSLDDQRTANGRHVVLLECDVEAMLVALDKVRGELLGATRTL